MNVLADISLTADLKEEVGRRLEGSGVFKAIDERIRKGMCAAIADIRGDPAAEATFKDLGFSKPDLEKQALQLVFAYLEEAGMDWTLETLRAETYVSPQPSAPHLLDFVPFEQPKPHVEAEPAGSVEEEDEEEEDA
jgi:hypothetical protein